MAFDPNSPASTHNALSDIDAIRNNLNELRKHEASDTEPSNYTPGMLWYDTSNNILKLRNEANTGWQSIWDFSNARVAADGVQSSSIKAGTTAVVVSSNDTTKGYLNGKLVAGAGITLTENSDGGAETLSVAVTSGSIGQNQLKTTTGSISHVLSVNIWGNYTLPGGEYGFYPQLKRASGYNFNSQLAYEKASTTYVTNIALMYTDSGSDNTIYAQQRYVTASGTEHWAFLLVNMATKQTLASWEAPDHPSYGNGDDPDVVPHPFADYWNKPLPEGHEIVLLDMDSINKLKAHATKKKGILEIIQEDYEIDFNSKSQWKPRDIDGHSIMQQPHPSWVLRSLKKKVK